MARFKAAVRHAVLLAATALSLAGCGVFDRDELFLRPSQYDERHPLQPMALEQVWIGTPAAVSVYMRPIYDGWEQQVNLVNTTALPGDNRMVLRLRREGSSSARLVFEEFVKWNGGLPEPFTALTSGELVRGEDSLGPYYFAEYRTGADTICVYGLRRLDGSDRQMPASGGQVFGRVMDVQMRNCGRGTPEDVLAPLLDTSIGFAARSRQADGTSRMLSALAAPSRP